MITRASRWYRRKVLRKYGFNNGVFLISRYLAWASAIHETGYGQSGYTLDINGIEVKLSKRKHFIETVLRNIVRGYTVERDVKQGDTVVDAGAFPGEFTIYAAKKCSPAKVLALEPDPENARQLRKNLELNNVDNVEVIEKGLWSEQGEIGFDSRAKEDSCIDLESENTIPVTTLDRLKDRYGAIDYVKMDVEEAELEALKGGTQLIQIHAPFFSIASYHRINGVLSHKLMEGFLSSYNYNVRTGYEAHTTTYGWKQDA